MYKSEAEYKRALSTKLRALGFSVQPIETPGTGLGIPDWYLSSYKHGFRGWIEFKNFVVGVGHKIRIPFEPGQFAWLTSYSANGTECILACSTEYGERYFLNSEIRKEYDFEAFIHWPRRLLFQQ